jgi:CheY-like chemotaxis protein
MKILIVDDDVLVALGMDDTLSGAGHHVVGLAREEGLAIRTAASTSPDLALIDLRLARDGSGAEVARKLRRNLGIAVVFVSGSRRLQEGRVLHWCPWLPKQTVHIQSIDRCGRCSCRDVTATDSKTRATKHGSLLRDLN